MLDELATANQALEEKVQHRTEQLEIRNRALEFSQTLLGNLPVGVAGIDSNGMIAYCNSIASKLLKHVCGDVFGADVAASCDFELVNLIGQVRREKSSVTKMTFGDSSYTVLGRSITFFDDEAVALVFLEVM
ncbi:MAG TPA: hypothetical protein HPP94_00890 [Desulfuromonadales bacterium]|nr:hypothetical protein [Desulfuromonadales bacterium]